MRLAVAEGGEAADRIFGPVAGYEELTEDQVKMLKEVRKEKEKEQEQARKQQYYRGSGRYGYRGRGGYHPYQQYQQPEYGQQQYVQHGGGVGGPAGFSGAPMGYAGVQQQPVYVQAPQTGYQGAQAAVQPQFQRDGYIHHGEPRMLASCYGCGVAGHYSKDNKCLPGAREAYQALKMGHSSQAAPGSQAALTYAPGPVSGGGGN